MLKKNLSKKKLLHVHVNVRKRQVQCCTTKQIIPHSVLCCPSIKVDGENIFLNLNLLEN